jgi:hypothetical protein
MSGVGNTRVRFIIATMKIRSNRTVGGGLSDDEILRCGGYHDPNEYWRDAMSQEMKVPDFVSLLEDHLLDPARTADEICGQIMPIRTLIESSLDEALDNGEPWFFRGRKGALKLHPRAAAAWMMRRTFEQDRVPATLRAFLEGENGRQSPEPVLKPNAVGQEPLHRSRQRGRKPIVLQRVKDEMIAAIDGGKLERTELKEMLEKTLAERFGASRDTCRKARDAVLSGIVEN